MNKFERPKFKVSDFVDSDHYGKFVITPLERGFGTTLGNALRRTMLSSLPGGAVYSIKIDGIFHEFSSIKGVKEDTTLIVLNIKSLILDIADDDVYTLRISAKGPCTVKAEDIILPAGVEVLNPDLEIAHLDKGGELEMELPRTELEQLQDYTFERTVDETDDEILKWNGGIYAIRSTVRWGGDNYGAKREEMNVIKLWRKKP